MTVLSATIDDSRAGQFGDVRHANVVSDGSSLSLATVERPCSLMIVEGEVGFYLYRLDASGACVADTWHITLDDAKAQAEHEYALSPDEWATVE